MIDIKALDKNEMNSFMNLTFQDGYRQSLKNRGMDPQIVDQILNLNNNRKAALTEAETEKAKQNKISAEVATLKRAGQEVEGLLKESQGLSEKIKGLEKSAADIDELLKQTLLNLPNFLHYTTPVGASAEQNKIIRTVGDIPKYSFEPKDHVTLGEERDLLDFNRAGKVTGSRFSFVKSGAARLERALIQFMMDLHSDHHGYEEMIPPFIVNSNSLTGTSQFPKFKEDVFQLAGSDLYLVPTAEVPVTNYYNDEILDSSLLPKSFVAYSPCFRSEAGSYGKDTKGLIRQHQFNKIELVKFTRPEESEEQHEKLAGHAEEVLKQLELPFRTMQLCSGDIGFGAMKCYDIEVWLAGQKSFREISSCSNFADFQARRANIRFKEGQKGKPRFVHTINGSGLAVGRTLIAILENYQQEDGKINVPKILQKYTNTPQI